MFSKLGYFILDSMPCLLLDEDARDYSEALGATLSEQYRCSLLNKLGTVAEAEAYRPFVV